MNIYYFNGEDLELMLVGSVNLLGETRAEIDALNVYPVPDGDTGSNMYLTLYAGVKEAQQEQTKSIANVAEAAARGCLYGARGNSGVILSQIMRGFADALSGMEKAGADDVSRAFKKAYEAAEDAVSNPVEGTILTVCREIANAYKDYSSRNSDLVRITIQTYRRAKVALENTPEQLPVLKDAGVVDAGGQGLVTILYGIICALRDRAKQKDIKLFDLAASQQKEFVEKRLQEYSDRIEHTYCTEFLIKGEKIPSTLLKKELSPYGDCLLVVGDDETVKIHIHSNHPGLVLECGLKYGFLQSVKINNMEEQSQDLKTEDVKSPKAIGMVAVGMGEGIATVLESMGVDKVVTGGQTMNPSAEEILRSVDELPSEEVIILPNNKNIIMAAEQAASMAKKKTVVIPTRSLPQGISALLGYNPVEKLEVNENKMKEAFREVKTGEITRAVKDGASGGYQVKENQIIGLVDGEIISCGERVEQVAIELIGKTADVDGGMVTLFFGAGLDGEEAGEILESLEDGFPEIDFELHYGGQPHYYFIISIE